MEEKGEVEEERKCQQPQILGGSRIPVPLLKSRIGQLLTVGDIQRVELGEALTNVLDGAREG